MGDNAINTDLIFTQQDIDKNRINYEKELYNIDAEQQLIGTLLTNNEVINYISDFLEPSHFYERIHGKIFEAILKFFDREIIATPVTLKSYFEQDENMKAIGGANYLVKIALYSTSSDNAKHYAKIIHDLYLRRKLVEISDDIIAGIKKNSFNETAKQHIEKAEQQLFNLAADGNLGGDAEHLSHSIAESIKRIEFAKKHKNDVIGVPTNFYDLDILLGGLQNSDLLILAGRPSMGKTALAINMALNASIELKKINEAKAKNKDKDVGDNLKYGVAFFSLEMSSEQLATRMLSIKAGINAKDLRTGKLDDNEFGKMIEASRELQDLSFFIDDTPALSISAIRTKARRLKRLHNISLIIVDYLQLVRGTSNQSQNNRVLEISEITQGLKAIAKELDLPVIALSQLSRAVESRDDKRPQLSDLRESGTIEQDADVVMFIYREEYYLERKRPTDNETEDKKIKFEEELLNIKNKADVIIAKQRNGPIGTARLFFDSNTTAFRNLDVYHS